MHTSDKEFKSKGALWPFVRRIFGYALRYRSWVIGLVGWVVIVAIIDAVFPLILKEVIDTGVTPELSRYFAAVENGESYQISFKGVMPYIWTFVGLSALSVVGVLFFIYYAGRIQEYVTYDLREAMFRKMQALSFSYYDRSASGWLLSRFTSDINRVSEVISWGLLEVVWGLGMMLFCIIAILIYNWQLGLIIALSVPIMLLASVRIRLLVLKYSRKARKTNSELTAAYNEHINGVVVNKSTAQEQRVVAEFDQLSGRMRRQSYRAAIYTALYIPLVLFIGSVAAALVLYFGGQMTLAVNAGITIGTLIAAFDYATKIFLPIIDISLFYARLQSSLSAGERIFDLIDEPVEIKNAADAKELPLIKGDIEFRQVHFSYVEGQTVLQNFNLQIKAGQSIALVGATGEGKSTITNLIARFYEPQQGQLLIDGQDYRQFTLQSLHRQMGMVLQTPHLFKGSILDNIRYGRPAASEEEVLQALEIVGAKAEFADRLEEAVGEEGGNLSLGEQQLLSFARAVLVHPRIFIMDEATSSIDTITEAKIQQSIAQMLQGRTSIIIAHRLSTIKHCDRILVIQKGSIQEDGTHQELMKRKGKYYELYTKQLRKEKVFTADS